MTHRDANERVRSWLKDFMIPAGAVLVTATGAWMRMEHVAGEHDRRITQLETNVSRIYNTGPDGFCDPVLHSAHDLHIRHEIDAKYLTREQWCDWKHYLFQLNPTLVQPHIDAEPVTR